MRKLPQVDRVDALRLGDDPAFDAWHYTFRAENNIEHSINPGGVASEEQLSFMVHTRPGGVFVPCSDAVFGQVVESYNQRGLTPELLRQYAVIWRMVARLVRSQFDDPERRRHMLNYCRHRFRGSMALRCILPNRLTKRLVATICSQGDIDPWLREREAQNAESAALLAHPALQAAMDALPASLAAMATANRTDALPASLAAMPTAGQTDALPASLAAMATANRTGALPASLAAMATANRTGALPANSRTVPEPVSPPQKSLTALHRQLNVARLARLLYVAAQTPAEFHARFPEQTPEALRTLHHEADAFAPLLDDFFQRQEHERGFSRVVLYLCSSAGGLLHDLAVVDALLRMGHKVVLALKEEPFFHAPLPDDLERDPEVSRHLPASILLRDKCVTKNELLRLLRERRLVIISDGTSESLNLYRTSVTFARAWKECDMVLAKGERTAQVLLHTTSHFTRDICCFWTENTAQGLNVRMELKLKSEGQRKFSEEDLNAKAGSIIREMRAARDAGKAVMFYSCIIGSIPGETRTAIAIAHAFVAHLRASLNDFEGGGVFIINPAEHFEPGMDGDDLMFMWETVQRSGLITIWRFQSCSDVEESFRLMNRPMPPVWFGKDATFSTGCTKEMRIALDMQRRHPELQLIGPDPEKFFRRANYGVGKFFDATLNRRQETPS